MDLVELAMAIEERFEITISDAEAEEIRTIGELCDCVARKTALDPKTIWHQVCDVVVDQLGVDRLDLIPDTRFIEDLGAD